MATLRGSVEADVPPDFADRQWREFIGRSVYRRYPDGYYDVASSIAEIDADDGVVAFQRAEGGGTRVSVELQYTPHDRERPDADVSGAQRRLQRDLQKYREFVLRRCAKEDCRSAA